MNVIQNRYEFVYFFDVENGNPNGDPDAGNMPRIDPETSNGLVTDVCLKRKVRNFVEIAKEGKSPYEIYIQEKAVLNLVHERAHQAIGVKDIQITKTSSNSKATDLFGNVEESKNTDDSFGKKQRKGTGDEVEKARLWMCKNFYDVRTFGAVMSTGVNCGQVRGPVQINFAKSIDPIVPLELSITRMAVTTEKEAESQSGDNRTMGRKHIVPYGLYRVEGYVSAHLAQKTGFSDDDLELFWDALINMFDHDHSAARGKMNARKLFVFKHENKLGNAPAHKLFDLVSVKRNEADKPPRSFTDYSIEKTGLCPEGVTLIEKL